MRLPIPYRPEADVVAHRLAALKGALDWTSVPPAATPWVRAVRDRPPPFWAMESLLREYPISSAEGLALMRLAEALLRVPDAETAIALTADQLGRANFEGAADSTLARLSSSAISLSKKFLPHLSGENGDEEPGPGLMARLGARTVVAATLRAVQLLGRQFVLGQTIDEAMSEARSAHRKHEALRFSYDMLGEGARTEADAQRYLDSYVNAIRSIAAAGNGDRPEDNDGISIKLSALHPRYEDAQRERVMRELVPRVWQLCELAADAHLNLTIDAEEVDRLELSLDVFEALASRVAAERPQWRGFGVAMQAYQTRALELIEHIAAIARKYKLRLMCRLVKGAYWDAEIKRAQELGLPHYPVFTHKHHTDVSYLACARALLAAPDAIYPQFATHNAGTIAAILQMAERAGQVPFELQRLHGMGEGIYREVMKSTGVPVRVYAPVGRHKDLLAYLVRRLLENGANSSFVNQLGDESVGMGELLSSPLWLDKETSLPLPPALYGPPPARRNSHGVDMTVESMRAPLFDALAATVVPTVPEFDPQRAAEAVASAAACFRSWSHTPVSQRAGALRHAADALEAALPRFCALLVKEAFKSWTDAIAEVREAVDFLRYYADEAERVMRPVALPGPTGESNELRLTGRGPWVCISPWNFPLAIFLGQVAAALATGNTVLAKPAEQTPAIASEAIKLLHAAGVPPQAVQLMHGAGETVGAALVAAPGVAGVVFTGSTQVAKIIHRALAAKDGPIVPLIAETGGINAMLVDPTALPEQVVDAVVQSAFRSAGQRCSALRLLLVHDSIADDVIAMIRGAANELAAGDPALLSTDVGPVIDREAFEGIQRHLQRLDAEAKVVVGASEPAQELPNLITPRAYEVPSVHNVKAEIFGPVLQIARWSGDPQAVVEQVNQLGFGLTLGIQTRIDSRAQALANLMTPRAYEVPSVNNVKAEIFGPVLQIARWSGDPQAVVEQVNQLGFGLTLGIQTRIDSRAQALAARAHVGNIYVNRNIIGAVVGVQPFGGEGLSGTGPKAGGPHYLLRFCAEQTLTINTAAAGGNAALLAASA